MLSKEEMSDESEIVIDPIKNMERAFLLSMDPSGGHDMAAAAGFVPSSPSVSLAEARYVLRMWMKLKALGIQEVIDMTSDWYLESLERLMNVEVPDMFKVQQKVSMMLYATSTIIALHQQGLIDIQGLSSVELVETMIDAKTKKPVDPDALKPIMDELEKIINGPLVDEPEYVVFSPWAPPSGDPVEVEHEQ